MLRATGYARMVTARAACVSTWFGEYWLSPSPNQVLTHAARAAAKPPLMVAALERLWLEQYWPAGFYVLMRSRMT